MLQQKNPGKGNTPVEEQRSETWVISKLGVGGEACFAFSRENQTGLNVTQEGAKAEFWEQLEISGSVLHGIVAR